MNDYLILSQKNFTERVKMCIEIFASECDLAEPLTSIPIEISTRMTIGHGYFQYRGKEALKLKFTDKMLDGRWNIDYVDEIIKHEVIHYLLFKLGYYKESHGIMFQKYCRKLGCSLTTGHSNPIESSICNKITKSDPKSSKKMYAVKCMNCGMRHERKTLSRVITHPQDYRCKCKGILKREV